MEDSVRSRRPGLRKVFLGRSARRRWRSERQTTDEHIAVSPHESGRTLLRIRIGDFVGDALSASLEDVGKSVGVGRDDRDGSPGTGQVGALRSRAQRLAPLGSAIAPHR